MVNSAEIRWFFDGSISSHTAPWDDHNTIDSCESRSDYYIAIRNCDYLGVKIRDRKLQVKWRKKRLRL